VRTVVAETIIGWLKNYDLAGTWADVAGLVGFVVTIIAALAAKSAAEAAKSAAENMREKIRLFDTVVDTQAVISALEDVKKLHRLRDWNALPEKYASIRRQLIMLREGGASLNDEQLKTIQNAVTNLSEMERQLDRSLARNAQPQGSDKLNPLISDDSDALVALLQSLKQRGGVN
jgi:Co/Zn/Cd efflux system component